MKLPINIMLCIDEPGHFGAAIRGVWPLHALEEAEVARLVVHKWPGEAIDDSDPKALEEMLQRSQTNAPDFSKELIRDVAGSDVIVLPQTACSAWYGQIKFWQSMGKVVVADADDDSFNVHPTSPSYGVRGSEECDLMKKDGTVGVRWVDKAKYPADTNWDEMAKQSPSLLGMNLAYNRRAMGRYMDSLKIVDAITTTTERAAKRFRDFNANVFVLPNSVDTNYYIPGRHLGRPGFRILWYGGNSHEGDLVQAGIGLGRFLKEHRDVIVVVAGSMCETLIRHIPPEQLEAWDWTSAEAHPWRLMGLGADLGICPVMQNSKFNDCKSALKWTEMGAIGVPAICTDAPPYSDAVKHGKDGWLVQNTPEDWHGALDLFYKDDVTRKRIALGARKRMVEDFDLYQNAGMWFECYKSLISARESVIVPARA